MHCYIPTHLSEQRVSVVRDGEWSAIDSNENERKSLSFHVMFAIQKTRARAFIRECIKIDCAVHSSLCINNNNNNNHNISNIHTQRERHNRTHKGGLYNIDVIVKMEN